MQLSTGRSAVGIASFVIAPYSVLSTAYCIVVALHSSAQPGLIATTSSFSRFVPVTRRKSFFFVSSAGIVRPFTQYSTSIASTDDTLRFSSSVLR